MSETPQNEEAQGEQELTLTLSAPTLEPEVESALQTATDEANGFGQSLAEGVQKLKAEREAAGKTDEGTAEDISEVGVSGMLLKRFLADTEEALRQVFVAGLSYPDPELPDELVALAERARRHGLPGAMERLLRLKVWVEGINSHPDTASRFLYTQGAWQETQKLVSWLRLFSIEFDFMVIESNLTTDSTGDDTRKREKAYPTATMRVWPLGIETQGSGMILIYGQDAETGAFVILRDQLAEFKRDNLFLGKSISRLFQEAVQLDGVLSSLIRLENHPVVKRKKVHLFRPAFRTAPTLLGVADNFVPPALQAYEEDKTEGPATLTSKVLYRSGRQYWDTPTPIETSDLVRFNVTKLLAREQQRMMDLDLVVRPHEDSLRILSLTTEIDGRRFITLDPTPYRLSTNALASNANETAKALADDGAPPMIGALLQATAYMFGGASGSAKDDLRDRLSDIQCVGLDEFYGLGLARFLLGAEPSDAEKDEILEVARATFTIATLSPGDHVPLKALRKVLGRPASSGDVELVEDLHVYQALWLVEQIGKLDDITSELAALKKRYSKKISSPTPGLVCARALTTAFAGRAKDPDKAMETALTFLNGHLGDLGHTRTGRRRRSRTTMAFPELLELFQLADTRAQLEGLDRHGYTVADLKRVGATLDRMKLAQMSVDGLYVWRTLKATDDAPTRIESAIRAAEAMLTIAAAGLKDLIIL
ncbi:MAG: hypothetical protein ACE366_03030 [Bradymonadia bacterium]